ncbi:PAS domain S-box protein [Pleurocapsales cyanobacterium LEGE 06147]|nr:PAS domain S-box protein [Pleurocapsales cyanobacterium LEGE 06147]
MLLTSLANLLATSSFMPHGMCYLWKPGLVGLHLISNAIIAVSYFSIPITLIYILSKRPDIPFDWIFFLFAAFIVACGFGHLVDIWTLWHPDYWFDGLIKAITALVSWLTAIALVYQIPQILTLPSPTQMEQINHQLLAEIARRKQQETALKESEQFLRSIYEGVEEAIFVIDVRDEREFVYQGFNPTCSRMTGISSTEVKGKTPEQILPPELAVTVRQNYQNCLDAGAAISYEELLPFEGKDIWWLTNLNPIRDEQGKIYRIVGTTLNITERKQAEEALKESEQRFYEAFEYAAIGMALVAFDGSWLKVNRSLCQITGYSEEELLSTNFQAITHPDDLDTDLDYLQQIFAGKIHHYQTEKRFLHKEGHLVWSLLSVSSVRDSEGKPLYLIAQIQDISARKIAEEELEKNERRFRAIFNSMFQFIGLLQPDGTVLEVNETALNFGGLQPEDVIGRPFWETRWWQTSSQTQEQLRKAIARAARGEFVRYSVDVLGADNRLATIDFSIKPVQDEQGKVVLLIPEGRDISEAKQAQQALKSSEERYRLIAENSSDLISIQTSEGIYRYVSPACRQLLGYESEQMVGHSIYEFFHPEDAVTWQKTSALTSQLPESYTHSYRIRCQDGRYIWFETTNRNIYYPTQQIQEVISISRDITKRKQAEQEITQLNEKLEERVKNRTAQLEAANQLKDRLLEREREAKAQAEAAQEQIKLYADIVSNMQVAVFVWQLEEPNNPYSLQLVATNPAAAELTGINTEELLDRPLSQCFPRLVAAGVPEQCIEVICSGQEKDLGEIDCFYESVAEKTFALRAFPLPNQLVGLMAADITHRKESERILQQKAKELAQLNSMLFNTTLQLERRNQELDQFAYVASHDLKAPLRAIANLSQWLEEDLEDKLDEDTKYQMDLLRGRVQRMENLINGLLQYSRVGRLKSEPEKIVLEQLIGEIVDSLEMPPDFTITIEGPMPTLVTERLPLQQVFSNLIINAIKHHDRPDGNVTISALEKEQFYEFTVADDGPGIDPQYHDKVFVIFQTLEARDKTENTGIGLSIVKKAVESQGGKIKLESQPGKGTIFRFTWSK